MSSFPRSCRRSVAVLAIGTWALAGMRTGLAQTAATLVDSVSELRARTPAEKARAVFFERFGSHNGGRTLIQGSGLATEPDGAPMARNPNAPPLDYRQYVADRVCASDAVIEGRPIAQRAFLNRSETFLFTDYEFSVEQWIRPAPPADRPPPLKLVVSRAGGAAIVAGRPLRAEAGAPFERSRDYVVLLAKIGREPQDGFVPSGELPIVSFEAGFPHAVTKLPVPDELTGNRVDERRFIADLGMAAATCGHSDGPMTR